MTRRVLSLFAVIAVLTCMLFVVLDWAPGHYLELRKSTFPASPEGQEAYLKFAKEFTERYSLDESAMSRAGDFIIGLIKGDVGTCYQYPELPLLELVLEKLPVTLSLTLAALLLSFVLGFGIGAIAAFRKNSWLDHFLMATSTLGIALPSFVLGVGLILFFSIYARRFMIGDVFPLSFLALPPGGWGAPRHMILPVMALTFAATASMARYARSAVLDVLDQPYMLTAKAKGLGFSRVAFSYVMRPSIGQLISVLPGKFSHLLVGTLFVEEIFRIPGLGVLFVQAAAQRDTPLVVATTLALVTCVMVFNILADLALAKADPRIKLD